MAQDTSISGLRNQIVTSLFGRRVGLTPGNSSDTAIHYLVGPVAFRDSVMGISSAGSTIVSTSVATPLPPYGVSLVGATGASATTAYLLSAPVPGVEKILYNPTTGRANVLTTDGGAYMASTASNALVSAQLTAQGSFVRLLGLTTALWGIAGVSQISTGGVGVTFA